MSTLKIGALAAATDTKVETVRYYERVGLLGAPARSDGNYRLYDDGALKRLSFIRRARALGFSLDQVRALLDLSDQRDRSCCEVDAIAAVHLEAVERKIADLTALRGELSRLLDQCRQNQISDCLILEALAPAEGAL